MTAPTQPFERTLRLAAHVVDLWLNRAVPVRADVRAGIESSAPGSLSPVAAVGPGQIALVRSAIKSWRESKPGDESTTSFLVEAVEELLEDAASTDESVVGRGPVVPPAGPRRLTSVSTDFPAAEPDRLDSELFYEAAGALLCCAHRPHIPRLVAELRDRGGQFEALGD